MGKKLLLLGRKGINSGKAKPTSLIFEGVIPPAVTFTRSTTKTYFDASGVMQTASVDTPAIDYLQDGSGYFGLSVEGSRTNLVLRSQQLNTSPWTIISTSLVITEGANTAPNNTLTGNKVDAVAVNQAHVVTQSVTTLNATAYTFSVFAKAGEEGWIQLGGGSATFGTAQWANFDLVNGVIGNVGTGQTASITPYPNGWYRCSITMTSVAATTNNGGTIWLLNNTNSATRGLTYTGTVNSGVYLWGVQLEIGADASSYIPTTTTALTRAADVPVLPLADAAWFNSAEGTIIVDAFAPNSPSTSEFDTVVDFGAAGNRVQIARNSSRARGFVVSNSVSTVSIDNAAWNASTRAKIAFAYKVDDYAYCKDAGSVSTDTSGALPLAYTNVYIGRNSAGGGNFDGLIKSITYYPMRLPDAILQTLTA